MLSDVPLGVFLSGGIDSSAIVAAIAQHDHQDVRTLTLHFTEEGYGEGPFAEQLAARYKTRHVTQPVSPAHLLARFDDALEAGDQPSIDGINTYAVCELARQSGLTVALCGHGGDELFGGYDNFRLIPKVLGFGAVPLAPATPDGSSDPISGAHAGLDSESGVPADEPAQHVRDILPSRARSSGMTCASSCSTARPRWCRPPVSLHRPSRPMSWPATYSTRFLSSS